LQSAVRRLSPLTSGALHRRIAEVLSEEPEVFTTPSLLFQVSEHWRASSDIHAFSRFVASHLALFVESGSPMSALQVIDNAVAIDPRIAEANDFAAYRSRLRLDAGEYAKALREKAGALSLPALSKALTDVDALESLALVDAAYRADPFVDRSGLLRFAVDVSQLSSLAQSVRLRAAEVALVIASNTGEGEIAKECIEGCGIRTLHNLTDDASRRVALIYHTIFGNRDVSDGIARYLLEHAKKMPLSTQRYHDLCRSAYALRFSGTRDDVVRAYSLGFETAMALDLPRLAQYPAWQISAVYYDAGQFGEADHWNAKLLALFETDDDEVSSSFVPAHLCRVAILRGQAEDARRYATEYARLLPRLPVAVASSFVTALQLGVELMSASWCPTEELLTVAASRHSRTAPHCASDFFTAKLVESLLRGGQRSAARVTLDTFVTTLRREALPLSFELTNARRICV